MQEIKAMLSEIRDLLKRSVEWDLNNDVSGQGRAGRILGHKDDSINSPYVPPENHVPPTSTLREKDE